MKFLQTKPHVKNMSINDLDLYYTIKINRNEKEMMEDNIDYDKKYSIIIFCQSTILEEVMMRYRDRKYMRSQITYFKFLILYN